MGRVANDIDLEVFGLESEFLKAALGRHGRVWAVGVSFGVLKLRLASGTELDVSIPRRESLRGERGWLARPDPAMTPREACSRRDFTLNAMAYDPHTAELLDFFGGQTDLAQGILRHTGPAFGEDPLRVLRGMQFAARWNFRLHPATVEVCAALKGQYPTLPKDRVWGEWHKFVLKGETPSAGLHVLAETGWLSLYEPLERLSARGGWAWAGAAMDRAVPIYRREGLAGEERIIQGLATLCYNFEDEGETGGFLSSLGCPQHLARLIIPLARERLEALLPLGPVAVRRLAQRLAPASIQTWERVVETQAGPAEPRPGLEWLELARFLGCDRGPVRPLLLGRDLQEAGLKPGPQFRQLLDASLEAQLDGFIATPEEAKAWLARHLPPQ